MNDNFIEDDSLDAMVEFYYADIYRYCYFKTGKPILSQDLTQEVFCRYFQRLNRYRGEKKTKQILFTITHNLCVDYFRKNATMRECELQEDRLSYLVEPIARQLSLKYLLNKLSNEIRDTMLLRFYYDFKIKDIAKIMNTTSSNVKYRISTGKTTLKQLLEKEGMPYEEWFS